MKMQYFIPITSDTRPSPTPTPKFSMTIGKQLKNVLLKKKQQNIVY